jgi:hypothetical protein
LIESYLANAVEQFQVVHVPRWIVRVAGLCGDLLATVVRRQLPIGSYRLRSAIEKRVFRSELAERDLGWRPRIGVLSILDRQVS